MRRAEFCNPARAIGQPGHAGSRIARYLTTGDFPNAVVVRVGHIDVAPDDGDAFWKEEACARRSAVHIPGKPAAGKIFHLSGI